MFKVVYPLRSQVVFNRGNHLLRRVFTQHQSFTEKYNVVSKRHLVMLMNNAAYRPSRMFEVKLNQRYYTTSDKISFESSISEDMKNVIIAWGNDRQSKFHSMWLRYNCQCSVCIDEGTNMQKIPVQDIPLAMTINHSSISDNGLMKVTWKEESHEGIFPVDFLKEHCYSDRNRAHLMGQQKPSMPLDYSIPSVSWKDVENSEAMVYKWLRHVNDRGLCRLTDVPVQSNYIRQVIAKIGYLTETMYGQILDVKAVCNATDRANTDATLHYHSDQPYYEAPPGLQFFHCLRFDDSVKGGNTRFVDLFHVLEEYRVAHAEEFRTLCQVPATFWRIHYQRENPVHMVHRKPIVTLNDLGDIIGASYHPFTMGPPLVTEDNVELFYRAFQLLCRKIESFPFVYTIRYNPGDVICVNNRRMLHGRDAFNSVAGTRHLQTAYANIDDFKSKLLVLSKYGDGRPIQRVGNNDRL